MTKARAIVQTGELECAMGLDDRATAGDHMRQSARVASLTSMCRHLTAELFADDAQPGEPSDATIARRNAGAQREIGTDRPSAADPQSATPENLPADDAGRAVARASSITIPAGRADIAIPPPPPHWPAWPTATGRPAAVAPQLARSSATLAVTSDDASQDVARSAVRDLAALRPRGFGSPAVVRRSAPAADAGNPASEPTASARKVVMTPPARGRSVEPPRGQASESAPGWVADRQPNLRLRRAPVASSDSDLPSLPKFLDPGPLVVTRQDRPAWINTGTRPPVIKDRPSDPKFGAARRMTPVAPRVRFGAFAGLLMFVVVAGVGVAAAALAPQIGSLMPQGNAPQILVEEVEGVSDAIVPLSVSVDPAAGTVLSTVVIDGVPEGARLSAGRVNNDGSWILPPEELANLSIMPPRGFAGEFFLEVRAVAVDGAERVGRSETMHVVIMPSNRTPQIRYSRRT